MSAIVNHIDLAATKLAEWGQRLDALEMHMSDLPIEKKADLRQRLESMRAKRKIMELSLTDARRSGTWEEIAPSFGRENSNLAAQYARALQELDQGSTRH